MEAPSPLQLYPNPNPRADTPRAETASNAKAIKIIAGEKVIFFKC